MAGLRIGEQLAWLGRRLMTERLAALVRFYGLLGRLEAATRGPRILAHCHGRMGWPGRGVYFFYEIGEMRSGSGRAPRVVHVGTHALTSGSRNTLWHRLSQHRGPARLDSGNHRGSILRLLVGAALANRDNTPLPPSWGISSSRPDAARRLGVDPEQVRASETALEKRVSRYIGGMPFLWLKVDDAPGPESRRGLIKRHAIALLSAYGEPPADPPSPDWLGRHSDRELIRHSGLWNNKHVQEAYDPTFLDQMEGLIADLQR